MIEVHGVDFLYDTTEEDLPGWDPRFPYLCSHAIVTSSSIPWHWHQTFELFYMEEGTNEYRTPNDIRTFPKGSVGIVNAGIAHASRRVDCDRIRQYIHLFSPELLSGPTGTLFEEMFMAPLTGNASLEMLQILPGPNNTEDELAILRLMKESFTLDDKEFGYELRVRNILSEIWLHLLALPRPESDHPANGNEKIKKMIGWVQEHFQEEIAVRDLADAAYISERECFRIFRNILNQTPSEYIRAFRIRQACRMLAASDHSIAQISQDCGFGTQQHFGYVFRKTMGCTPGEFRRRERRRTCP